MEGRQLDDEVDVNLLRVEAFHEAVRGAHGPTRGEQVVVEEDHVVLGDGVLMDLDGVLAVLLVVVFLENLGRQFARLARHDESGSQPDGEGGSHDESARFDTHNLGNALVLVHLIQDVLQLTQTGSVLEEGGHVPEQDAGYGKVSYSS